VILGGAAWSLARRNLSRAVLLGALVACSQLTAPVSRAAPSPTSTQGLAVTVDATHPGRVIPTDFLGLSLETTALRSPAIQSTSPELVRLLRALGTGLLRVSGDSVDRTQWLTAAARPAPWAVAAVTPADLGNLATLARATGWRVLVGLDLGHEIASAVVDEARTAASTLGSSLAGLAIGNEPDLYTRRPPVPFRAPLGNAALRPAGWGFEQYANEITHLRAALAGAGVSAPQDGPDTATGAWLDRYAARETPGLAALTQHLYPLDRCHGGRVVIPGPTIPSLLSARVGARETAQISGFMRAAVGHGVPLRIDETNSVACAGQPNTSDTFAAALWAVDFSLRAARQGVVGLNFHGGLGSCQRGGTILSPWYSPLCTLPDGRLRPRPEYYALLVLRSLERGAFVRVAYRTSHDIAVYALRAPDASLRVVVDDMDTAAGVRSGSGLRGPMPVRVTLRVDRSYRRGSVIRLTAPGADAKQGVTLGGASVRPDGSLPAPKAAPIVGGSGSFALELPPASVAVVTLTA
jgi:Glycosyl hydrolase family 79 C-terminal beta domain